MQIRLKGFHINDLLSAIFFRVRLFFYHMLVTPAVWATIAVLSVPHSLYAAIWLRPAAFIRLNNALTSAHPVDTFAFLAAVLKAVQYVAVVWCYWVTAPPIGLANLSLLRLALGLALLGAGQVLNAAVYRKLGKAGVYYGCRLGKPTPWQTGFPFNTVSHPQYTGSVLSIWGAAVVFCTAAHLDRGFYALVGLWTLFYIVTTIIEDRF
jgi:uncharacterized membrane protein YuzA (DUF378 family)